MLILGILTLSLIALYIYYYQTNEVITERNKYKYKIFGPNPILVMLLVINIMTLLYCTFLMYMYGKRAFTIGTIRAQLKAKCPEFRSLRGTVIRKFKSKFN